MLPIVAPSFAQEAPLPPPVVDEAPVLRRSPAAAGWITGGATLGAMVAGSALLVTVRGDWRDLTACSDFDGCVGNAFPFMGVGVLSGVLASGVVPMMEGLSPWVPLAATAGVASVGTETLILVAIVPSNPPDNALLPGLVATLALVPVTAGLTTALVARRAESPEVGVLLTPEATGLVLRARW